MSKIKDLLTTEKISDEILLIASAIKKNKEFVLTHPEYKMSIWKELRARYFLRLLNKGYSVAVILHHKEFFGLDFYIDKNVLVPRPDTEIMVEEVLKNIQPDDTLIDVGTGSGCILISILKNITIKNAYGLDTSVRALCVAKKNAKIHNVFPNFLRGNLMNTFLNKIKNNKVTLTNNIFITANLPYLTQKQFDDESSIQREPHLALVANNDGLELYKKLLKQLYTIISNPAPTCHSETQVRNPSYDYTNKKSVHLFLEIDPSQTEKIKKIVQTIFPTAQVEIKKDLSGLDRLVAVVISRPR